MRLTSQKNYGANLVIKLSKTKEEVETEVMKSVELQKYLNGTSPKKVIVVPGRIVNIVC